MKARPIPDAVEYAVGETREMLERLGFEIRSICLVTDHLPPGRLRRILSRLVSLLPAARTTQVVVAEKRFYPDHRFNFVEANS